MNNLSAKLFEDMPTIIVNDNQECSVRTVEVNRAQIGTERSIRISRTEFNATGYASNFFEPRFFLQGLTNQNQQHNLASQLIRIESVDTGEQLILPDVTGATYLEWDEKGKRRRYEYDTALHRLIAVHEKASQDDMNEQVLERWVYGQQEDALLNLNLQVKAHYDLGGCLETEAIGLTGQILSQRRRLLWDHSAQSNWQGETTNQWNKHLSVKVYDTAWTYNALGQWLAQRDAQDNIQRQEYDCTGRLSASYFQAVGSEEIPILILIQYNANGQVILEKFGNGVETRFEYDTNDWCLTQMTTTRPEKAGRVALLQSINYSYDPAGNLLSVKDDALKSWSIEETSLPELLTPQLDSHQLQKKTLSSKKKESYQYSQRGVRLRKNFIDENNAIKEEVIYLPNLEIRELTDIRTGIVKERLNVVLISGNRRQVRELQWDIGLPSGMINHQLRYRYDNGVSRLELNNQAEILNLGAERDAMGLYHDGY